MKQEYFASRLGMILSVLGIAIGTGNIWRFPRIVAQNDGGSFLIPWLIFLFIWSIPLILAEFAIGKYTRKGAIGAFATLGGAKYGWMGGFIGFVATAIMFYYSVVTGWCIYYVARYSFSSLPTDTASAMATWSGFQDSYLPVGFHFLAIGLGALIVHKGVVRGIERINKILVPSLLIILLIAAVRALTLDGAFEGIRYFLTPNFASLGKPEIWLAALTQNAWDTGAGWGLIMAYAIYLRPKENIGINASLIAFGNNSISLLAGLIIFSTVFAVLGADATTVLKESGPASTGLTFIWMPQLFNQMPFGQLMAPAFFIGLTFAAFSSLISMIELATRLVSDSGVNRSKALFWVFIVGFFAGIPSALSLGFFLNQDWVWGVGLIISGAFISFIVLKFGVESFREKAINNHQSKIKIGKWWSIVIQYIVPLEVVILLGWWLYSSTQWYPNSWWHPFNLDTPETLGTCVVQWAIVMIGLIALNSRLVKRALQSEVTK